MTDRPIIFSPPMVRALLAGCKTQTRRLATLPLRRVEIGDRLYVREHWKTSASYDETAPRDLDRQASILTLADDAVATRRFMPPWGRHRQAMHMPRWASRLTLIAEGIVIEPLQSISEADAIAEGIEADGVGWRNYTGERSVAWPDLSYQTLWDTLHTVVGERWQDNPSVVALTFRVERSNIDHFGASA